MKSIYFLLFTLLFVNESFTANLIYFEPVDKSLYANINTVVIMGFDTPVNISPGQFKNEILVTGSKSGRHFGEVIQVENGSKLIFKPDIPFMYGEKVTVEINNTSLNRYLPSNNFKTEFSTSKGKVYYNPSVSSDDGIYKQTDNPLLSPPLNVTISDNPSTGYIFTSPWNSYTTFLVLNNDGTEYWSGAYSSLAGDFKKQKNGLYSYYTNVNSTHYVMNHNFQVINYYMCSGYNADIHDFLMLDNGNVLMMAYDPQTVDMSEIVTGGHPDATVIGFIIQELDANRNVVFQWRSWDHFEITDATHENLLDSVVDYVHGNAFEIDYDNNILLSSRHLDEITKINHSTGNIIWRLGGKNNQFTFIGDTLKFSHQHDIRRLPNGNITLFDNGNYHPVPHTRVLEYRLDEINKTAELEWQYRNNPDIFSPWGGNAQRLPGGNTLIGWGGASVAVSEVTPAGNIALQGSFPANIFSYRSYKFDLTLTSAGISQTVPDGFNLEQNYPNPFNPSTKISYSLPKTGLTTLSIYDVSGKMIKQLVNSVQNTGSYTSEFDAAGYSSGVYFYVLRSGEYSITKKMILLK